MSLLRPLNVVACFVLAFACLLGWLVRSVSMTSLSPDWVSMKFGTAATLLLLATGSHAGHHGGHQSAATAALLACGTMTLSIMGLMPEFETEAVMSIAPDVPSIGTAAATFAIAASLLFRRAGWLRLIAGVLALVALVGYMVDKPALYFWFPGVSSAMALTTAICFLLLAANDPPR